MKTMAVTNITKDTDDSEKIVDETVHFSGAIEGSGEGFRWQ